MVDCQEDSIPVLNHPVIKGMLGIDSAKFMKDLMPGGHCDEDRTVIR